MRSSRALAGDGIRAGKLYPSLSPAEFRAAVADAFGLACPLPASEAFFEQFACFLGGARGRGRRILLVVEEAQGLGPELLADIERLLEADAPAASDRAGILSVLLVGHDDLGATLRMRSHLDLASRISACCQLDPLDVEEVAAYMRHRLAVAGIDPDPFTGDAVREVAAFSRGWCATARWRQRAASTHRS